MSGVEVEYRPVSLYRVATVREKKFPEFSRHFHSCTLTFPQVIATKNVIMTFIKGHSTSRLVTKKGSPYSIAERRVPELIPVFGSQPAGDVSHKPGGRLPLLQLLSQALRGLLPISLLGEQRHNGCEQFA